MPARVVGSLFAIVAAGSMFVFGGRHGAQGAVFGLFAWSAVFGAAFTMTRRNPVAAVMSLVATFLALAGLFAMLDAHFLAVLQVLVYAGAIMVLFIFVVMILNREEVTPIAVNFGIVTRLFGVAAGVYLLVKFADVASDRGRLPHMRPLADPSFGTVSAVGDLLFRDFLFPFEAVSLLLLVAIVGGVVVSHAPRARRGR